MENLVKESLKHRLIPLVVPSFRSITVGGAFSGTAAESSSYKFGYFSQSVKRAEVILGNGSKIYASCEEHSDIFSGLCGGLGTIGIVTLLEVSLVPVEDYVEITYSIVPNPDGNDGNGLATAPDETITLCQKAIGNPKYDFVDGIVYGPASPVYAVIICALITNEIGHNFTTSRDSWFFVHASSRPIDTGKSPTYTETIPITDYLFRYDCGAYWLGKLAFGVIPYNTVTKKLISIWMGADKILETLRKKGHMQNIVIQDGMVPIETAEQLIHYMEESVQIYPLWLCPVRSNSVSIMEHPPHSTHPTHMLLNVGIRGCPDDALMEYDQFKSMSQGIEKKIRDLGGLKWLYPPIFYTEEEFWKIYNRGKYSQLREKYHARLLLDVYEKVKARKEVRQAQSSGFLGWCFGRKTLWSGG